MSHVITAWTNAQAWINAYPYPFAVAVVLVAAIAVRYASWSAGRAIRRRDRRYLLAQARQARARGLDLTYAEADVLARRRWRRRSR